MTKHIKMTDKPTACLAPLVSIAVQPKGRLRPCCWWWGYDTDTESNHKIQSMSFNEYRESANKKYYQDMQKGLYPEGCKRCNTNAKPRYEYYNKLYPELVGKDWDEVKGFKHLDLRFGNLCNASCVTCNYTNSSYFGKVADKGYWMAPGQMPDSNGPTHLTRESLDKQMSWHEDPKVIEGIIESLKDVNYIYATGGEPTINPTLHKVMQYLIDEGRASHTTIEINTNGTNANKKFLDLLKPFKKVIQYSMDAAGELNDAMRYPTKFVQMEKNYFAFKDICSSRDRLMITPTVTIHNFFALPDLMKWVNDKQAAITAKLNILNSPHWQSIAMLSPEYLQQGLKAIADIRVVLTTEMNILGTDMFVTDISQRLLNTAVYQPNPENPLDGSAVTWQTSLDYTRKWFDSRGYNPALTKIPDFL